MDARPNPAIEGIKFFEEKGPRKLTGTIGTEIEKQNDIVIAHALFTSMRKNQRRHEFVGLTFLIFCRHRLGWRGLHLLAPAKDDRVPRLFGAVPAPVPVHRKVTTNDGYNLRTAFRQSLFALAQNLCPTGWGGISSIGKGVHKNFFHSCLVGGLDQRQEMEIMTVHASIRDQAEQLQTMVARFLEAILEHGIVCQLAGGERFVNSR